MTGGYLFLKRNIWSFRIRVPHDLHSVIRKKELKYSLKTGSSREAKKKADKIADQVQSLFKKLRKDIFMNKLELTPEKIQQIVSESINRILMDEIDDILTRPLDRESLENHLFGVECELEESLEALQTPCE